MSDRRIVITGVGAANPLGLTVDEMWDGLKTGKSGIDTITAFDPVGFSCRIAGQVPEFKVRNYVPKSHRKATKLMSRDIELSIVAANEAIEDSGLVTKYKSEAEEEYTIAPDRFAINMGTGLISCDFTELAYSVGQSVTDGKFDIKKWGIDGLNTLTPLWLLKYLPNMLPCHVGIIHDIRGPSNTITCGEAGSYLAIGEAMQVIKRGDAEVALAGGCEAKVNAIVMARQCLLKRVTTEHNESPATACRPFAKDATGSVFGESAALVILEELETARGRGAKIYAEVAGLGQSTNLSTTFEKLEQDGKGVQIAIRKAMEEANITPDDIDLIIPNGSGIPADDAAEAAAITRAMGANIERIPVLPTKAVVSHTGSGAGCIDTIAAAKAISTGLIPAAVNCDEKFDGCKLNIVSKPIETKIRYALCCGYTFGSQTAALVLKNIDGEI